MLSKTGFRYANYLEEKKGKKRGEEEKGNTQPQGWHPGLSLCQAVWFLRELDGF